VGVKGRYTFGDDGKWFVPFYLDVGTGQSQLTWQISSGLGYSTTGVLSLRHGGISTISFPRKGARPYQHERPDARRGAALVSAVAPVGAPRCSRCGSRRRQAMLAAVRFRCLPTLSEVRTGHMAHEIVDCAKSSRLDLIVLGAKSRSAMSACFWGQCPARRSHLRKPRCCS
jgi:hypothetical protein